MFSIPTELTMPAKVEAAKRAGKRMVGGLYRRRRPGADGVKVQRAEIRFDDVAGCLRMPTGGSSIQTVMIIDGDIVRTRRLSAREAARLMGVGEDYRLPTNYLEAYGLMGDGVVVPVVRHLAEHILEPLLRSSLRILNSPDGRAAWFLRTGAGSAGANAWLGSA
jgi:DNA (cytosine-5)-methyltransferase 1